MISDSEQNVVRSKRFAALSVILLLVFASALALALQRTSPLESVDIWGLLAFGVLAILSEAYPLRVPVGHAYIGVSGTIYWALFILFEPAVAGITAGLSFLITDTLIHRRKFLKGIFNASQIGLSTLLGAFVFLTINESVGLSSDPIFFVAFGSGVLVYWVLNTAIVSIGASVLYGEAAARFWRRNFQWSFVYELTSAPVTLAIAFAYSEWWLIGLPLVILPLLMIRLAYSQYLQLKKTYHETVRTLIKIIEMHDPYTAGHSDRVATYSRMLCEALRLSPSRTEKIELAAYLHDLGKIHLDLSGIVRKAGKLNEEERRLVRLHSVVSADLANQVSYFRGEIEAMIRHHHENWDGSGYPHGLKGDQIPLGARIILLADAFDAMTTSRVYRDALDLEKVKAEFRKFAGIQFDPRLVPVFLDQVLKDGENLIKQPIDEPIEGQRARLSGMDEEEAVRVHSLRQRSAV